MSEQELKDLEIRKAKLDKLKEAAKPLLKLLCAEYHPHHTMIITGTSFELLEGVCSEPKIFDFVVD